MAFADGSPDELAQTKPKFKLPEGFDDEAAFLADMRQKFYDDDLADRFNREAAADDLSFFIGDQWDRDVRAERERAAKPTITVHRLPAFVAQVVGSRRLNETSIKILPDNGGTEAIARLREGLVRSIQKISRAELAYDKALENQVICGIGNFKVALEYASDDVFEQDIRVRQIPNALAVLWDRMAADPTGSDADHVFEMDNMPLDEFKRRWPWATPADLAVEGASRTTLLGEGWLSGDDVRVVAYWRMCTHKRTLALMQDSSTQDVTDAPPEALVAVQQRADGSPIMREVEKKYAELYICSGTDILEGPYKLPISRVPIFRVPGWEVNVGERRHRWGLVRFLKDPLRIHNFSRSILMEKMMSAPRAKWLAGKTAVQGYEKDYREAHLSDNPLLTFNDDSAAKPELIQPTQLEAAWLEVSQITAQDIKDVSNIHEANLGMPSNEVSGAAIVARQRVSDTGTILYHDNLAQAIEQAGMVINDLIPIVYDTPRMIKVLGDDGKEELIAINQNGAQGTDITSGRYYVSVVSGTSYQTKRIEAAQSIISFINAAPETASLCMDILAKNMDWPGAEELTRRFQLMLPPGLLNQKDMTPEMQARAQQQAQQSQAQQKMQMQQVVLEFMKTMSETAMNNARAKNFEAESESAPAKLAMQQTDVASRSADRELRGSLEAIKTAAGA